MPAWVVALLQALPTVIAEITALIQAIQQGGGTPTPAQKAQLDALMGAHDGLMGAVKAGVAA